MNGRGVLQWPNGEIYDGDFVNDKRNGRGINTWPEGHSYDGGWKDG